MAAGVTNITTTTWNNNNDNRIPKTIFCISLAKRSWVSSRKDERVAADICVEIRRECVCW